MTRHGCDTGEVRFATQKKTGGEIVFEDLWRIYRRPVGDGEFEYSIFHNGEYFASAGNLTRAEGIIKAMRGCE
jgi:hypothetical protein